MADKKIILSAIILAAIGAVYAIWAIGVPDKFAGGSADDVVATGDLFEGKITNMNTGVKLKQSILGTGVYDRNCVNIGNGLTDCHAGIQTKEYGLLDFNHVHNKAIKPCIVRGDEVVVEILDSGGNAKVQRIYPASKAAEQETEEMTG